jgi:hypothetical protein
MAMLLFSDAVAEGLLVPAQFSALWVEAGKPSGGSDNQLELPRGAHRFFGFGRGPDPHLFGRPVLVSPSREWKDRKLTWHGQGKMNRMERLNLPTLKQGGFPYIGATILFVRQQGSYELTVARPSSRAARAWLKASREAGHAYWLGESSPRRCGLF